MSPHIRLPTKADRQEQNLTSQLLSAVFRAHGGLRRWRSFQQVEATIVTAGGFWAMKHLVQDPNPRHMTVALHQQRASLRPFGDPDWHTEFTPERIAIVRSDGTCVAERANPRASFVGHELRTPWDPLHRAYFNGYALWTYLTTPFLLGIDGARAYEIDPWAEHGETWRVLRAEFADQIATHSAVQDFYFDGDLLLRRHDYKVDVAGGFAAAQLVYDYVTADGIQLPSKRRAYMQGADRRPNLDQLMVAIDISGPKFS